MVTQESEGSEIDIGAAVLHALLVGGKAWEAARQIVLRVRQPGLSFAEILAKDGPTVEIPDPTRCMPIDRAAYLLSREDGFSSPEIREKIRSAFYIEVVGGYFLQSKASEQAARHFLRAALEYRRLKLPSSNDHVVRCIYCSARALYGLSREKRKAQYFRKFNWLRSRTYTKCPVCEIAPFVTHAEWSMGTVVPMAKAALHVVFLRVGWKPEDWPAETLSCFTYHSSIAARAFQLNAEIFEREGRLVNALEQYAAAVSFAEQTGHDSTLILLAVKACRVFQELRQGKEAAALLEDARGRILKKMKRSQHIVCDIPANLLMGYHMACAKQGDLAGDKRCSSESRTMARFVIRRSKEFATETNNAVTYYPREVFEDLCERLAGRGKTRWAHRVALSGIKAFSGFFGDTAKFLEIGGYALLAEGRDLEKARRMVLDALRVYSCQYDIRGAFRCCKIMAMLEMQSENLDEAERWVVSEVILSEMMHFSVDPEWQFFGKLELASYLMCSAFMAGRHGEEYEIRIIELSKCHVFRSAMDPKAFPRRSSSPMSTAVEEFCLRFIDPELKPLSVDSARSYVEIIESVPAKYEHVLKNLLSPISGVKYVAKSLRSATSEKVVIVYIILVDDKSFRIKFGDVEGGEYNGPVFQFEESLDDFCSRWRIALWRGEANENEISVVLSEFLAQLGAELVIFVPHGPLCKVPFHLLPISGGTVIEKYPVAYSPSLTILGRCLERNAADSTKVSIFGAQPRGPKEKLIQSEARAVADCLKVSEIQNIKDKEQLIPAIRGSRIVHFSAHGIRPAERKGLLLFPFAVEGSEILWEHELWNAEYEGMDLMYLSACHSGLESEGLGDRLHGLSAAALAKGVRTVIAPMPASVGVADAFATAVEFYTAWTSGLGKAKALQKATLAFKRMLPPDAPPSRWAAFVLNGDPLGKY